MKTKMKQLITLLVLIVASASYCWSQSVAFTIQNETQIDSKTLQFDLYIQNTSGIQVQVGAVQAAISYNTSFLNGGTITATIVTGSSQMVAAQAPLTTNTAVEGLIKIAGRSFPGCGSGTILSTSSPGTKFCTVQITSTVAFTANSTADLAYVVSGGFYTKFYQYKIDCSANEQLALDASNCTTVGPNLVLNIATGTELFEKSNISVFANNDKQIEVHFNNAESNGTSLIKVFTVDGKLLIATETANTVYRTGKLTTGFYTVTVQGSTGSKTGKVVVK